MSCLALSGCHISAFTQHHPRSIEELYDEAVAARAKYPEHTRMHDQPSIPTERPGEWPGEVLPPSPVVEGQPPSRATTNSVPGPGRAVRRDRNVVPAGATQLEAQPVGPRVSEIFEETEIRQAIQILATQAGQSVVVDDRVGGVTSAHIENEPFDSALRKILLPLGFVFKRNGDQYLIGVIDPQSAMFPQIAESLEFRPMHLAPLELMQLLPDSLKKYVQVIEKRNLMLIEAPEDIAQRIALRLEQSDRPVPQVILEAMVCVINPTKSFQFNVDAKQSLTVDGKDLLNVGLTGLAFTGQATPAGMKNAFSDFALTSVFLRLLAQEGYVTIRAAPRVMAKDGEKATISISRETFFSVQPINAGLIFQSNLQQIDAGITLDITPVVRGDTVTVNIERAEVSEPIRQPDQADNNALRFPLINRRKVATTVHVQDGQTIVIGGLVQRQTIDRVSRIPYLGDMPYVGRLFQYIDQEDAEAEVVIFIAPRIVNPPCAESSTPGWQVPVELPVPTLQPQVPLPPAPAPDLSSSSPPALKSNAKSAVAPSNSALGGSARRIGSTPSTRSADAGPFTAAPTTSAQRLTGPAFPGGAATQSAQPPRKTLTNSSASPPASPSPTKPSESEGPGATSAPNSSANPSEASHTAPRELRFLAPKVVMPPAGEQPGSSK
ncbi:MAG: protein transporter [Candidatus Saccharimonas sp.]|nr:protein transporter [Planctomycetaceae bacterium]